MTRRAETLDPRVPIVLYADEWGGVGGTAGYVVALGRGLRRRGYRVAAICYAAPGVAPMRERLAEAGVDVRPIEGGGGGGVRARLRRLAGFAALFREYPGAVLALMMGYFTRAGAVSLAASLAGAGAVVRADLTPPEPPITRRQRLELRAKDHLVDRVVVGAMENVEAFSRQLGRARAKMRVIHTGIELDRFSPGAGRDAVRQELGYGRDDLVVGTLSRLDDTRKGVHDFLEMAARVSPLVPSARFLIVGDGVLRRDLEAQARGLGLGDRVTFAGWRNDAPRLYAGMDVFVMPSLFEGGPTTVLEAMAMARAVVATRVGMVPEVVEPGRTGLVVPPGDVRALAPAVATLLQDADLRARLGGAARAHAERAFSIDLMVERYLEVFGEAVAARAGRGVLNAFSTAG